MRIFITCPNINSHHGGIRVILEWANRLQDFGHEVIVYDQNKHLKCTWFDLKARVVNNTYILKSCDCLIVTSPHAYNLLQSQFSGKRFVFLQMMEDMFNPKRTDFNNKCRILYNSPYDLISISEWNMRDLIQKHKRRSPMHYVGNGINLIDFPISKKPKSGKVILLESPEPTNWTKDVDRIALQVAERLFMQGYTIKGYGLKIPKGYNIFSEFVVSPDSKTMNRLYEEATILLKCTKCDARSTAPMEAMTKGTVTVRGIIEGDDDLNETNSFKVGYNLEEVYSAVMESLTTDISEKRENCYKHIETYSWDYWMTKINNIING